MTWNLAQAMNMIKAAGHKYTHRKLVGKDPKTGRKRYRYYYAEHHGGGITSAKFEEGAAFKLTFKNRRGHFHVQRVEGDKVFVKHDGRPGSKEVEMSQDELRALLERQHSKTETKSREKAQANRRKGRKSTKRKSTTRKKTQTQTPREQLTETAQQSDDNFETMPNDLSTLTTPQLKEAIRQRREYVDEVQRKFEEDNRSKDLLRELDKTEGDTPDLRDARDAIARGLVAIRDEIQEAYNSDEIESQLRKLNAEDARRMREAYRRKKEARGLEARTPKTHGADIPAADLTLYALPPRKLLQAITKVGDSEIERLMNQYADVREAHRQAVAASLQESQKAYNEELVKYRASKRGFSTSPRLAAAAQAAYDEAKAKYNEAKEEAKRLNPLIDSALGKTATLNTLIDENHRRMYQVSGTIDERLQKIVDQLDYAEFLKVADGIVKRGGVVLSTPDAIAGVFKGRTGAAPTAAERHEIERRVRAGKGEQYRNEKDRDLTATIEMRNSLIAEGVDVPNTKEATVALIQERASQAQTPRDQLTETAQQSDENFETMPDEPRNLKTARRELKEKEEILAGSKRAGTSADKIAEIEGELSDKRAKVEVLEEDHFSNVFADKLRSSAESAKGKQLIDALAEAHEKREGVEGAERALIDFYKETALKRKGSPERLKDREFKDLRNIKNRWLESDEDTLYDSLKEQETEARQIYLEHASAGGSSPYTQAQVDTAVQRQAERGARAAALKFAYTEGMLRTAQELKTQDETTQQAPQRSQTARAFSGMVDAIKSGDKGASAQAAQKAFKAELNKVIDKAESGTLTDAERAELLPIAEQLVAATSGRARGLMTAVRDQIKGSST